MCGVSAGRQALGGEIVFVLSELPTNLDTTAPGWQQQAAESQTSGVRLNNTDRWMFVEWSNGVARRVAIVARTHVVLIVAEVIDDVDLPASDVLTMVAQDLSKLADSILLAQ